MQTRIRNLPSGTAIAGMFLPLPLFLFATFAPVQSAAEPQQEQAKLTAEQTAFFEKKIRPALMTYCFNCHSGSARTASGGFRVDTPEGLTKGGKSGAAIVPGNPERSLFLKALHGNGARLMPPGGKLPEGVIADFTQWIKMGAPDPRSSEPAVKAGPAAYTAADIAKGKQFWSFKAPARVPPTPTKKVGWAKTPVDRYVLAAMEAKGLQPGPDAEKRALLRRVYFDLIGLPPTPEEIAAFYADKSPDAFAKVVDKLLASPAFGERWGKHWMDVARYAESSGKEVNVFYPFAWRYRDYVIQSFNKDKPYDRFLQEQLAGDLMNAADDNQKAEQIIATGYLAIGVKSHNERNRDQFRLDVADEQIDAMSQGMLGLTLACARCHDHKSDPIPQKDYYALAGIFTSTEPRFGVAAGIQVRNTSTLNELPQSANVPTNDGISERELAGLQEQLQDTQTRLRQMTNDGPNPQRLALINSASQLRARLSYYNPDGSTKKLAMGVRDGYFPQNSPLYLRGELDKATDAVPRGMPQVLCSTTPPAIGEGSGRLELAQWVASPQNPLTARVMANRVWLHLFGRGIVPTPDNFGKTGQKPTHPALLDHLAVSFVENGWSVKKLIRGIVLSRTYQMSAAYSNKNAAIDPDNIYLWRHNPRRLEGEAIRDSMLKVSGELITEPPVASPIARIGDGQTRILDLPLPRGGPPFRRRPGIAANFSDGTFAAIGEVQNPSKHRSVYMPIVRDRIDDSLAVFDFPDASLVTGARQTTTVPPQALYLMNDPFVIQQAEAMAQRIYREGKTDIERVKRAFLHAFSRSPLPEELEASLTFLAEFPGSRRRFQSREEAAWSAFCQSLFATAEFRSID